MAVELKAGDNQLISNSCPRENIVIMFRDAAWAREYIPASGHIKSKRKAENNT